MLVLLSLLSELPRHGCCMKSGTPTFLVRNAQLPQTPLQASLQRNFSEPDAFVLPSAKPGFEGARLRGFRVEGLELPCLWAA